MGFLIKNKRLRYNFISLTVVNWVALNYYIFFHHPKYNMFNENKTKDNMQSGPQHP